MIVLPQALRGPLGHGDRLTAATDALWQQFPVQIFRAASESPGDAPRGPIEHGEERRVKEPAFTRDPFHLRTPKTRGEICMCRKAENCETQRRIADSRRPTVRNA